jgi:hypothetical protein
MLDKVSKCSMLMEKVSVAFSFLMIVFLPGCGEYMADDLHFWL